jgi:hypothetical protein
MTMQPPVSKAWCVEGYSPIMHEQSAVWIYSRLPGAGNETAPSVIAGGLINALRQRVVVC